jgi:CheY-like chemotaxis protein/signal transduction histidine kinase
MSILNNIITHFSEKVIKKLDPEKANKAIIISFAATIAIFFYLFFGAFALIKENYNLALILSIASALNFIIYIYLFKSLKTEFCAYSILLITGCISLYCLATGGAFGTGYFWIFPFPILAIALKGLDKGTRVSALFLILVITVCVVNLYIPSLPDYDLSFSLRLIGSYALLHFITYIFEFISVSNKSGMKQSIKESKNEINRKNDFLSTLSHQIRTPLNNITLIYNLVDRSKLPPDQQDLFDTIIASTNNLVDVVNNMVQVSAIDIEKQEQDMVNFNVESTIENTLKIFKDQNKDKFEIDFKTLTKQLYYKGNPVRIKQLFLNLIENIVKINYIEKIKLSISFSSQAEGLNYSKLTFDINCPPIKLKKDGNDNYFVVSDNITLPISDVHQDYLDFGITRKIVQLYKGTFDIFSGDRFTSIILSIYLQNVDKEPVIIPRVIQDGSIGQIFQIARSQRLEDANVLLVEDNSINQKIVILSLKNKVKNVEVANNGKEALDKFGTTKYDLILMDIQMPIMNGIIATKKIRELESSTSIQTPIIAITANALSGDKEACLAAGMNDYISKPFQVDILLQKMRNLLTIQNQK